MQHVWRGGHGRLWLELNYMACIFAREFYADHSKRRQANLIQTRLLQKKLPERVDYLRLNSGGYGSSGDFLLVGEAPLNLVALVGGASLAALLIHGAFESATTAHFLEDTLGVELGLEALKSAIDRFSFTYGDGTHDRYDCC